MDNTTNNQQNTDFVAVKQERSDYDGQYTYNDQSQTYDVPPDGEDQYAQDDQSQACDAPPDGSVDDGSHDGSLSTWNQSTTNDDTNAAAGSQQVRDHVWYIL